MKLVWTVQGKVFKQSPVLPAYRLAKNYRPVQVWSRLETPISGRGSLQFDINVDGVSLFDDEPVMVENQADALRSVFTSTGDIIEADELNPVVVTLDIDTSGGSDLTIILELEEA